MPKSSVDSQIREMIESHSVSHFNLSEHEVKTLIDFYDNLIPMIPYIKSLNGINWRILYRSFINLHKHSSHNIPESNFATIITSKTHSMNEVREFLLYLMLNNTYDLEFKRQMLEHLACNHELKPFNESCNYVANRMPTDEGKEVVRTMCQKEINRIKLLNKN